jgi:hypothetical protein
MVSVKNKKRQRLRSRNMKYIITDRRNEDEEWETEEKGSGE